MCSFSNEIWCRSCSTTADGSLRLQRCHPTMLASRPGTVSFDVRGVSGNLDLASRAAPRSRRSRPFARTDEGRRKSRSGPCARAIDSLRNWACEDNQSLLCFSGLRRCGRCSYDLVLCAYLSRSPLGAIADTLRSSLNGFTLENHAAPKFEGDQHPDSQTVTAGTLVGFVLQQLPHALGRKDPGFSDVSWAEQAVSETF